MASVGAKASSDIDHVLSDVVNETNEENGDSLVATRIELIGKGKIKWNGPYDMLQKLMVKLMGEDVSWSSTGGDCKMLKSNEVEVRAYTSSQSLIINEIKKEDIKSKLHVVNSNSDNTTKLDGEASGGDLSESQSIGLSNSETLINIVSFKS